MNYYFNVVMGPYATMESVADDYLASGATSVSAWVDQIAAEAWKDGCGEREMPEAWRDHRDELVRRLEEAVTTRPRVWAVLDGHQIGSVEASDADEAEQEARAIVLAGAKKYDMRTRSVPIGVVCAATAERVGVDVQLDVEWIPSFELHADGEYVHADGEYVTTEARTRPAAAALCARLRAAGCDPSEATDADGAEWIWLLVKDAEAAAADGLIRLV